MPSGHDLVAHRPATIERKFEATEHAPAAARRCVDVFTSALDSEVLGVLRLIVSELVTNAVEHGKPSESAHVTLRLMVFPGTIAAVVEDDGPGFDAPPPLPHEDAVDGWGLHLVSELADRFGIESTPRSSVWFELERQRPRATAVSPRAGTSARTPAQTGARRRARP